MYLVKMYDQDGDMELDFDEFSKLLQGKRVNKGRVPLKNRTYSRKHSSLTKNFTENQIITIQQNQELMRCLIK